MQVFEKPLLATGTHEVGGNVLKISQFSAFLFYNFVMDEASAMETVRDLRKQAGGEVVEELNQEDDRSEGAQLLAVLRKDKAGQFNWCAASVTQANLTGSESEEEIRALFNSVLTQLRINLGPIELSELYHETRKLCDIAPKPATPAENSATDSQESSKS